MRSLDGLNWRKVAKQTRGFLKSKGKKNGKAHIVHNIVHKKPIQLLHNTKDMFFLKLHP